MAQLRRKPHSPLEVCYCCGQNIYQDEKAAVEETWEGRMSGYCLTCSDCRCDAYPSRCQR